MAQNPLLGTLKSADPDRYLSVLYAAPADRNDLTALYAFNAEIGSVRDRISQPLPGEIRLQWWRDLVEKGTAEDGAGSPVASALLRCIEARRLPRDSLVRMIDARIFDLYDDPMPSVTDLEGYAGETASALIQLASLVLAPREAPAFAAAAGHGGCAQAVAGLLRSLPIHRARGQCYVPAEILAAAGTDRDAFVAGSDKNSASRAVEAMASLGRQHVAQFRALAAGLPPALRPAYLPAAPAPAYLDRIEVAGAEALERSIDISPLRRHFVMARRALSGW